MKSYELVTKTSASALGFVTSTRSLLNAALYQIRPSLGTVFCLASGQITKKARKYHSTCVDPLNHGCTSGLFEDLCEVTVEEAGALEGA